MQGIFIKTIGRVSTLTGINIETIRYYEKIRLIDEPERSEGGNRLYFDKGVWGHSRQMLHVSLQTFNSKAYGRSILF